MPSRFELMLDSCASPTVGPRRWGAYFVCGVAGYLAGLALVTWLGMHVELSLASRLVLAFGPPTSLLFGAKVSQIVYGSERLVFYEQAVAAVGIAVLGAVIVGGPRAVIFDLATLGVGTFLGFGRVGCFRVACCHGRRARRGVAYRVEHADAGFPARWVGYRLFPLQLVDGGLSAALVVLGSILVVGGAAPGVAACAYACGYGLGRFVLELYRGDPVRPTKLGVTEAQWIAVVTTLGAALYHPTWWTIATTSGLALAAAALIAARRTDRLPALWLTTADHVAEIATAVEQRAATTTREGVRVSVADLADGRTDIVMTRPGRPLPRRAVRHLAAQLGAPWIAADVLEGRTAGLVHVVARRGPE